MMAPRCAPLSGKIQNTHRDRWAVVYVRQSTLQQVTRHQESTRLQYGLVERAVSLGWLRSQVQVIDDDLGKSGADGGRASRLSAPGRRGQFGASRDRAGRRDVAVGAGRAGIGTNC